MELVEYGNVERLIDCLSTVLNQKSTKHILQARVMALSGRRMRQLAQSFCHYCSGFQTVNARAYARDPSKLESAGLVTLVSLSEKLATQVPSFSRALERTGFHTLALSVAYDFRQAPGPQGKQGSVLEHVAFWLLYLNITRAWECLHVIPQLLSSKLLRIIVDAVCTPGSQGKCLWLGKDPMPLIGRLCHHPRVFSALTGAGAFEQVSEHNWEVIRNDRAFCGYFAPIFAAEDLHYSIGKRIEGLVNPLICACLEVSVYANWTDQAKRTISSTIPWGL
jgi:hypothetical protein